MTRKYYEVIAKAIKRQVERTKLGFQHDEDKSLDRLDDLAHDLAGEFAADNPRFDTARFLKACGLAA